MAEAGLLLAPELIAGLGMEFTRTDLLVEEEGGCGALVDLTQNESQLRPTELRPYHGRSSLYGPSHKTGKF
ncbi:MAG: hypothetical protein EBS42_08010 [Caulobacteraceae bacterium]|nr:hypothetical protein [Caulobacteraceae bacterium]